METPKSFSPVKSALKYKEKQKGFLSEEAVTEGDWRSLRLNTQGVFDANNRTLHQSLTRQLPLEGAFFIIYRYFITFIVAIYLTTQTVSMR